MTLDKSLTIIVDSLSTLIVNVQSNEWLVANKDNISSLRSKVQLFYTNENRNVISKTSKIICFIITKGRIMLTENYLVTFDLHKLI